MGRLGRALGSRNAVRRTVHQKLNVIPATPTLVILCVAKDPCAISPCNYPARRSHKNADSIERIPQRATADRKGQGILRDAQDDIAWMAREDRLCQGCVIAVHNGCHRLLSPFVAEHISSLGSLLNHNFCAVRWHRRVSNRNIDGFI